MRRFNFFQYADYHTPSLKPMRNPDVTVRWRGVMEKCTYCVQRISAARITAKEQNRRIRDGEVSYRLPAGVSGAGHRLWRPQRSRTARSRNSKRSRLNYSMLGELNTRPRTTYLAKVRNPHPELDSDK